MRKLPLNKKGSYLVEGALCLPLFIVFVVVLLSVILMYAAIENGYYCTADEMRRAMIEVPAVKTALPAGTRARKRISEYSHLVSSCNLAEVRTGAVNGPVDKAIKLSIQVHLKADNPMNLMAEGDYRASVMGRAYEGKERMVSPASAAHMQNRSAEGVYVFPKRGEKYHKRGCTFLKTNTLSFALTPSIRKKYKKCPVCRSGKSANGTMVYVFPEYGESFHLQNCNVLQRKFTEIERETALERGYSPCGKCGG